MRIQLTASLVLCTAALTAQTQNIVYHPDNTATAGTINGFPFGSTGTRTQQLIPQSALGSTPAIIQDLFVAPTITSSATGTLMESEVVYGDFEIRMGLTQQTVLTNTWATNSTNPTTVYRGPLRVKFYRDQWVPLGLPAPYLWLPLTPSDNLVIDFINWSLVDRGSVPGTGYYMHVRSGGTSRAYLINWVATQSPTSAGVDMYGIKLGFLFDDGNFVSHGGGCPGSNAQVPTIGIAPGTWPQLGNLLDLRLTQGPTSLAAGLVLGFNNVTIGGTVPLPLDLTPFGAPGCFAWHEVGTATGLVSTDAMGNAQYLTGIPNIPGLMSLRVFATWLCFDPLANPVGLTTSGFGTLILGT